MKRVISIVLSLLMLLTLVPMSIMADEVKFSDVKDTDYYADAAKSLADSGILTGYPDGTFGAAFAITRAEMAAIVCRMIKKDTTNTAATSIFTDVPADHWAIKYIAAASEAKIINGDGDGTFRPEDDVLFEEAVKMVVCALGFAGDDIKIDPVDWSKPYIDIANAKGVIDNVIGAKGQKAVRGDIAVMAHNGLASTSGAATVQAPVASVKGGTYTGQKKVTLQTATKDAKIYYTLDGKVPSAKSTLYTKEITISKTCTLKAIAILGEAASNVVSEKYTIKTSTGGSTGTGSSGSKDDEKEEVKEPTAEEIAESKRVYDELEEVLETIAPIKFEGKGEEIIKILQEDIEFTLEAADKGTLITNKYVRNTYKDDIDDVKDTLDNMTDTEKEDFKVEMNKINTKTLMSLVRHFNINISYFM